jgi:hypothetical protein
VAKQDEKGDHRSSAYLISHLTPARIEFSIRTGPPVTDLLSTCCRRTPPPLLRSVKTAGPRIRFWDKVAALDKAMRHLDLYDRDNKQQGASLSLKVVLLRDRSLRGPGRRVHVQFEIRVRHVA